MPRKDLLPGIDPDVTPRVVFVDSKSEIRRARRRAIVRDVAQIILLAGVDWLFIRWPYSHVPMVDRAHSMLVVGGLNAALLLHLYVSRALPRWSARRIATTWCLSERARFFAHGWGNQAHE